MAEQLAQNLVELCIDTVESGVQAVTTLMAQCNLGDSGPRKSGKGRIQKRPRVEVVDLVSDSDSEGDWETARSN
jgi:hypothetical protein